MADPVQAPSGGISDPAPLGLAAFALTTFLLSAKNADLTRGGDAWLGYALAYGGIAQLLAGMWEFRRNNVFGATAFSTYGSFWIGLFLYIRFAAAGSVNPSNDLGWIVLAFAIFNTYMLVASTRVNMAVFGVFLTLEITEIVLVIGYWRLAPTAIPNHNSIIHIAGWFGILTALVAWYASFAGVMNGPGGGLTLPVGRPMGRF